MRFWTFSCLVKIVEAGPGLAELPLYGCLEAGTILVQREGVLDARLKARVNTNYLQLQKIAAVQMSQDLPEGLLIVCWTSVDKADLRKAVAQQQ